MGFFNIIFYTKEWNECQNLEIGDKWGKFFAIALLACIVPPSKYYLCISLGIEPMYATLLPSAEHSIKLIPLV